jgi:hypothetical protein
MLENLRRDGFVRLGIMPWIDDFVAHVAKCERYAGHVKARKPKPGIECHAPEDVIAAPGLLDAAKILTPLASEYFGEPAVLWSLNAFYTMPDAAFARGLHGLHSDHNTGTAGDKLLALFVLGFDADITGAQLHVRPDGLIEPIYGPAGTAWLADQSHLHAGLIPEKPRMLLWARWAEKIPQAWHDEKLPVIP